MQSYFPLWCKFYLPYLYLSSCQRLIPTAAVSCVFRRRLRQTHVISADARGKLEKFLISKKKYAANCGRVNEPLRLIHITAFSACVCGRRLRCSAEIEKFLSLCWCSPLRNPQTAAASVNEPLRPVHTSREKRSGLVRFGRVRKTQKIRKISILVRFTQAWTSHSNKRVDSCFIS